MDTSRVQQMILNIIDHKYKPKVLEILKGISKEPNQVVTTMFEALTVYANRIPNNEAFAFINGMFLTISLLELQKENEPEFNKRMDNINSAIKKEKGENVVSIFKVKGGKDVH